MSSLNQRRKSGHDVKSFHEIQLHDENLQRESYPYDPDQKGEGLHHRPKGSSLHHFFGSISNAIGGCTSRNVNSQVVPVDNYQEPSLMSFTRNFSTKSGYLTGRISDMFGGSKEKDLLEFILNIQMEFSENEDTTSTDNNVASICFVKYRPTQQLLNSQSTQFRKYLKRVTFSDHTQVNSDDINQFMALIDIVINCLDNIRKMEEGFYMSPNKYGQTSVSLEGCLALTDITMMAAHKYLEVVKVINSSTLDKIAQSMDNLFLKCHSLGPLFESSLEPSIKLLLSQTISRACMTIRALTKHAIISPKGKTVKSIIQISISLMQSLSPNLILSRRVCEDTSSLSTLLFWICGDILIHLVYQNKLAFEMNPPHNNTVGSHNTTTPVGTSTSITAASPGYSPTYDSPGGRMTEKSSPNPTIHTFHTIDVNRKMVLLTAKTHSWHNWSSRIRHALQSTLLTPQEFFGKVSRLKHTLTMRNSTIASEAHQGDDSNQQGYETVRSQLTYSPDNTQRGRSGSVADMQHGPPQRRHSLSTMALKSITTQLGQSSNSINMAVTAAAANNNDSEQFMKASYRLKHSFIGFQYLLHITMIESKDMTLGFSNINDWISSFAESFLLLLPTTNISLNNERLLDDDIEKILPFLIELWFHMTIGIETLPQHDWLYWELTKRLSHFVEQKQKQMRNRISFVNSGRSQGDSKRLSGADDKDGPHSSRTSASYKRMNGRRRRASVGSVGGGSPPSIEFTKKYTKQPSFNSPMSGGLSNRKSSMPTLTRAPSLRKSPSHGALLRRNSSMNNRQASFKKSPSIPNVLINRPSFHRASSRKMKLTPNSATNSLSRSSSQASDLHQSSTSPAKHSFAHTNIHGEIHEEGYNEDESWKTKPLVATQLFRQESGISTLDNTSQRIDSSMSESTLSPILGGLKLDLNGMKSDINGGTKLDIKLDSPPRTESKKGERPNIPPLNVSSKLFGDNNNTNKNDLKLTPNQDLQPPLTSGSAPLSISDVKFLHDDTHRKNSVSSLMKLDIQKLNIVKENDANVDTGHTKNSATSTHTTTSTNNKVNGTTTTPTTTNGGFIKKPPSSVPIPPIRIITSAVSSSNIPLSPLQVEETSSHDVAIAGGNIDVPHPKSESAHSIDKIKEKPKKSVKLPALTSSTNTTESTSKYTNVVISPSHDVNKTTSGFKLNDIIDGLYTLTNGTKRWYHGKITQLNVDGTYDVTYDDGDIEKNKIATDIRLVKSSSVPVEIPKTPTLPKISPIPTLKLAGDNTSSKSTTAGGGETTPSHKLNTYFIGEAIDGLYRLSNGTQRWCAGIIEAVNGDGTYKIKYKDGDTELSKVDKDIRKAKTAVRPGLPMAQSLPITSAGIASLPHGTTKRVSMGNVIDKSIKRPVKPINLLSINDEIYGLYTLPNGKKRWFPGKVLEVYEDETFKIEYTDSEIEDKKPLIEIRKCIPVKSDSTLTTHEPAKTYGARLRSAKLTTSSRYKKVSRSLYDSAVKAVQKFSLGEDVYGLYTLPKGKARWFPGTIAAVHLNGTFKINYHDGDTEDNKVISDIRRWKRNDGNSTCTSVRSNTDAFDFSRESIGLSKDSFYDRESAFIGRDSVIGRDSILPRESTFAVPRESILTKDGPPEITRETMTLYRNSFFDKPIGPPPTSLTINRIPTQDTSNASTSSGVFSLNQQIDGLYTLTNGTKRWYHGKITQLNVDGTYDVTYDDGDIEKNKIATDIRGVRAPGTEVSSLSLPALSTTKATFEVGESVDGLFKIGNGTQRWYPGIIDAINGDGTYKFRYRDGSNQVNKKESELRKTKLIGGGSTDVSFLSQDTNDDKSKFLTGRSKTSDFISPRSSEMMSARTLDDPLDESTQYTSLHDAHSPLSGTKSVTFEVNKPPPTSVNVTTINGDSNDEDDDTDEDEADDFVFTIPSVFGQSRTNGVYDDINIPNMNFNHLNLSGALSRSVASNSLSSCLLIEGSEEFVRDQLNDDQTLDYIDEEDEEYYDDGDDEEDDEEYYDDDVILEGDENAEESDYDENEHVYEFDHTYDVKLNVPQRSESHDPIPVGAKSVSPEEPPLPQSDRRRRSITRPPGNKAPNTNGSNTSNLTPGNPYRSPFSPSSDSDNDKYRGSSLKTDWATVSGRDDENNGSGVSTPLNRSSNTELLSAKPSLKNMAGKNGNGSSQVSSPKVTNDGTNGRSDGEDMIGKSNDTNEPESKESGDNKLMVLGRQVSFSQLHNLPLQNIIAGETTTIIEDYRSSSSQEVLMKTFRMTTIMLLRRCIVDKYFLDPVCCSARVLSNNQKIFPENNLIDIRSNSTYSRQNTERSDFSSRTAALAPLKHINLLFNIREYLDLIPSEQFFALFVEISNTLGAASTRLLKLLTEKYFISCLPSHLDTAEKIGGGGFGSIYRFTCPGYCSKSEMSRLSMKAFYAQLIYSSGERNPYLMNTCTEWLNCPCCRKNEEVPLPDMSMTPSQHEKYFQEYFGHSHDTPKPPAYQYAVKRIPRERSVHDNQIICAIYDEVTSLECVAGLPGVCQIIDYGVHRGEYWIVMEAGGPNLSEWRKRNMDIGGYGPFKRFFKNDFSNTDDDEPMLTSRVKEEFTDFSDTVLSVKDTALCLAVFVDILYIMQSIHRADVAHFDLKCDNLVLRGKLDLEDSSTNSVSISESFRAKKLHDKVSDLSLDYRTLRFAHSHNRPSGRILLVDFGESMSHISSPKTRASIISGNTKVRGTMFIQSPEILCLSSESYSRTTRKKFPLPGKESDIWSLGCILVELLCGNFLFAERQWVDLYVNLCASDHIKPESLQLNTLKLSLAKLPTRITEKIIDIVINTLQQMPSDRPNISTIITWVNEILNDDIFRAFEEDTPRDSIVPKSSRVPERIPINETFERISQQYIRIKETLAIVSKGKLFLRLVTTPEKLSTRTIRSIELESPLTNIRNSILRSGKTTSDVTVQPVKLPYPLVLIDSVPTSGPISLFQTQDESIDNLVMENLSMLIDDDKFDTNINFSRIENLLNTSDIKRTSRDLAYRTLQHHINYRNLIQIIFVESPETFKIIQAYATSHKSEEKILPILVGEQSIMETNNLMNEVLKAFTLCRNHLHEGSSVLITVGSKPKNPITQRSDLFDYEMNDIYSSRNCDSIADDPMIDPEYSRLCISIACCLVDCLSTWESITNMIPTAELEEELMKRTSRGGMMDNFHEISTSRASQVREFITQKVAETSLNENSIRTSLGMKASNTLTHNLTEVMMEMRSSSQAITSISPILETACCRRVSKIVADHLGRHCLHH